MKRVLLLLWIVGTAALIGPDLYAYVEDRRNLRDLSIELAAGETDPHRLAWRYSDAVLARMRALDGIAAYPAAHRPFLRDTAWHTWTTGKGFCGEGARVIVNLLIAQGIPASRVNMIGPGFVHTAAAYEVDGAWYLVDSVGAPGNGFREWARANAAPLGRLVEMEFDPGGGTPIRVENPYFTRYSFFNWARLIDRAEVNQRVPFPVWVTLAIENPPLLTAILKAAGAIVVLGLGWLIVARNARRRHPSRRSLRSPSG